MMKLAKAYLMLQTCYIKHGSPVVVHEPFEVGNTYATKDIPEARLLVWIRNGFCVPAGSDAEVTPVATQDEKELAAQNKADDQAEKTAAAARVKADKLAKEKQVADERANTKEAKQIADDAKKQAAEDAKAKKAADKKANAEKALEDKEAKAAKKKSDKDFSKWVKLWDDVSPEDYPKYVVLAEGDDYQFDDAPDPEDQVAWLAYFVPFFGEDGPPDVSEVVIE